jgi:hypothetical protein
MFIKKIEGLEVFMLDTIFEDETWKKSILELREGHTVAAQQTTWYKGGTDGGKGWFIRLASCVFIAAKIHHAYTKKKWLFIFQMS